MVNLVEMFTMGGPTAMLVVPVGLMAGLFAVVVPLVLGFLKWRVPASLSWLGMVLTLGLGVAGTLWGMQMAWEAVAVASEDIRATLTAAGASVAMYSTVAALVCIAPIAMLACVAGAIPAVAAVGPEPRFDARGLLVSAGVAVVGGVVALGTAAAVLGVPGLADSGLAFPLTVVVSAFTTFWCVVASARIASEDHLHQGRIAGSRFFVGMTGALAVILVGETFRAMGLVMATDAMARASVEVRPVMQAAGFQVASSGAWLGWILACVPAATAAGGAMHWVRRVEGRNAIGGVVMAVLFLTLLALLYAARAASVLAVTGM